MWKRALIYGAAIAIAGVLLLVVMDATGLEGNQALGYLGFLFPIIGIVLAIRSAKREETGEFTFGDGFKEGAAVSLVAALLGGLLTYLYLNMVNPGYLDAVREAASAQLDAQGMTGREREQVEAMTSGLTSAGSVAGITAGTNFVLGLIISAVAAAIMRRKADPAQYR